MRADEPNRRIELSPKRAVVRKYDYAVAPLLEFIRDKNRIFFRSPDIQVLGNDQNRVFFSLQCWHIKTAARWQRLPVLYHKSHSVARRNRAAEASLLMQKNGEPKRQKRPYGL